MNFQIVLKNLRNIFFKICHSLFAGNQRFNFFDPCYFCAIYTIDIIFFLLALGTLWSLWWYFGILRCLKFTNSTLMEINLFTIWFVLKQESLWYVSKIVSYSIDYHILVALSCVSFKWFILAWNIKNSPAAPKWIK